eukprot:GHVS01041305.1.p1 GENE.GHVS01041305.1~~GHVS01041305.1.p1  ORF type:complete len:124 (+),score=7.37 GHVS01041305.1:610-981(+)
MVTVVLVMYRFSVPFSFRCHIYLCGVLNYFKWYVGRTRKYTLYILSCFASEVFGELLLLLLLFFPVVNMTSFCAVRVGCLTASDKAHEAVKKGIDNSAFVISCPDKAMQLTSPADIDFLRGAP